MSEISECHFQGKLRTNLWYTYGEVHSASWEITSQR